MEHHDLIVSGERRPARDGAVAEVHDPSTGEAFATVAQAGAADVDEALSAAQRAHDDGVWASASSTDRGRVLAKVAELIRERADRLAVMLAKEAGHPLGDGRWEAGNAAATFEYYAGAANKHFGEVVPVQDPGLDVVLREPVGVCALIVPWNFPLMIAAWKVAPALACGNPIVLKPASLTPLSALMLGQVLLDAGLPPAAVTVLVGPGATVGQQLVEDRRVAKLSFTGDSSNGANLLRSSAPNITRVSLELGGKSACIVFADADWKRAAADTPYAVFGNAGQDCCARSRVLVERSIYDDFVAAFTSATQALRVGEPLDEATEMGPLISAGQRRTSLEYLDVGRQEGARLVCGGDAWDRPGWFMSPAVLADVDNRMRVAQEEIFGPVASIIPFDDEADAVRIANDSDYGLSGSLWTGNLGRAVRVSKALRTGVISVNTNRSVRTEAPFGGYKRSGLGRELGMHAMAGYTEVKNVFYSAE